MLQKKITDGANNPLKDYLSSNSHESSGVLSGPSRQYANLESFHADNFFSPNLSKVRLAFPLPLSVIGP